MTTNEKDRKNEARIEKALDTLAQLCDTSDADMNDAAYQRRAAAEEILRHYRETEVFKNLEITVHIDGHVPVRPVQRP